MDGHGADLETRLDVARSLRMVGRLRFNLGDAAGALRDWQEMRDIAADLETESPTDAVRQQLALSHHIIGRLLTATGKLAEALEVNRKALAIRQKLLDAEPSNNEFQAGVGDSHDNIGRTLPRPWRGKARRRRLSGDFAGARRWQSGKS